MEERYSRTALLLGAAGVEKLKKARVAVFGLGGVGSWCAEALAEVMAERVRDIDPACAAEPCVLFYLPETADALPLAGYDYIADCIDNVTAKVHLICAAKAAGVPVISAMGAGNKLDGTRFRVSDLAETSVCPLARIMRRELKKRGAEHLPVCWSDEPPVHTEGAVGSVPFVPSVMGLCMAQYIVKELIG